MWRGGEAGGGGGHGGGVGASFFFLCGNHLTSSKVVKYYDGESLFLKHLDRGSLIYQGHILLRVGRYFVWAGIILIPG